MKYFDIVTLFIAIAIIIVYEHMPLIGRRWGVIIISFVLGCALANAYRKLKD